MLSEVQGVSLRITSGVRFRRRPNCEGFGDFAWRISILVTVSKTVLRHSKIFKGFKVQFRKELIQARRGGLRARGEGTSSSPPVECNVCIYGCIAFDSSNVVQIVGHVEEEFNDFLTLYPIPSKYHVILHKSNQVIFDAPPGFIYRGSTLLVVPNSPLLLSCAKLMVVSPLSTSSEGSSIYVELIEDGPHGGHPWEETRMTCGVPSLALSCSRSAS
ncbi:hypothetical protein Tco_1329013 [Tanacetum coccineum]